MSELRIEKLTMPSARLGPENPLPAFGHARRFQGLKVAPDIPEAIARNVGYGQLVGSLPYTLQDAYTRDLTPRDFRVAVLENDLFRATFLLEYGGRLWSLVHKPSGRELLEINPVFQLANLAIRNAWFSGGVEWNVGLVGHSPFTCAPLFAARVERDDGSPMLRLYEWERFRQSPFQIDAYLVDGVPVLFVCVRLTNPNDCVIPVYWWSNIAVPERPDVRVIVPAGAAYWFGEQGDTLSRIPVPVHNGIDCSRAGAVAHAADIFFHIPAGQRPYIAALDGAGRGLVHTSTDQLHGRKLWVWGKGMGGRNWQKLLSPPGEGYIEIQAGLAHTQVEHLPMPPGAAWAWGEAYGLLEADSAAIHGADWQQAQASAAASLERLIPRAKLDDELAQTIGLADRAPVELIQRGSGWGALERRRREKQGLPPFCSPGLVFDDQSLGGEQVPWLALLETGHFPDSHPAGFMVEGSWQALLEDAIEAGTGAGWAAWLHAGVMRYHNEDRPGARRAWEQSLRLKQSPWALRNLAVLARAEGDRAGAANRIIAACRMEPSLLPLAIECGQMLIEADRSLDWLGLLAELPENIREAGRIRLLEAQAALKTGSLEPADRFFAEGWFPADLREGENSLTDLWFDTQAQRLAAEGHIPVSPALRARAERECPLPAAYDFRMVDTGTDRPADPEAG
jgi:hypothetical protein